MCVFACARMCVCVRAYVCACGVGADANACQSAIVSRQHVRDFPWPDGVLATPTLKLTFPHQTSFGHYFVTDLALSFLNFWCPPQDTRLTGHKHSDSYRDCDLGRNSVVCKFNMGVW